MVSVHERLCVEREEPEVNLDNLVTEMAEKVVKSGRRLISAKLEGISANGRPETRICYFCFITPETAWSRDQVIFHLATSEAECLTWDGYSRGKIRGLYLDPAQYELLQTKIEVLKNSRG